MKKVIAGLFLIGGIVGANAQAVNEVKINILNTILSASVEVGYEHFIDHNQSIGVDLYLNDRFSYSHLGSSKKHGDFNTNSIGLNYRYYLGDENDANGSGLSMIPFLKYRFGNFKEDKTINDLVVTKKTDMNSFIVGFGAGYKWIMGDSFAIEPFANIGRNFSSEVNDRFSVIEFNAGVNIGYRF